MTLRNSSGNSTTIVAMEVSFREIFLAVFYSTVMIVSFTGNCMILAAVYRNKNQKMRTVSNLFIVNMSSSDIVITLSHLPFLIYNLFQDKWLITGIVGHVVCGVFKLLVYLSIDVSMLSLAIVAADRFWGVYYPTRRRMTTCIAKKIIAVTWLFSVAFSLPIVVTAKVKHNRCFLETSSTILSNYTKIYMASFVFIPLLAMVSFYVSIGIKLRRHKIPGNVSKANADLRERQNRRITKMLVTISSLFIICWFPYGTVHSLFILQNERVPNHLFDVTSCLAYFNYALNPVIYVLYNHHFRFAFKDICRVLCRCSAAEHRVECRNSTDDLCRQNPFERKKQKLPQTEDNQTLNTKL